jgi:ribonuclease J
VRLIPLGGLGEIGLNALVVEQDGRRLLIDAGLMFTNDSHLGVDIVVPDFAYLRQDPSAVDGIVLTHGHEDHIGALPFLLRDLSVPVYGSRFTLALVRARLEQAGVDADLREIAAHEPFKVGETFDVEPLAVTHSIPDALGLSIQTRHGRLVHTGDFKLDTDPLHGHVTDLPRFESLGDEGVLCLLSDSTNAESVHPTGSERDVAATFERLMREAKGRTLFSFFASNLHRAQLIVDLCQRLGKKLSLSGRGMARNVGLGQDLGILRIPPDLVVNDEQAASLPDRQLVVLVTGTQGEPRSGLWQLALGEGGGPGIKAGDLVVLSARAIPGNERAIAKLVNALYARGATVATARTEPGVHVSGHAASPEQLRMLRACKPKHFMPIHGELRHLHRHLALARESGLSTTPWLAQDGHVLELDEKGARFGEHVPAGRVFIDRAGNDPIDPERIKEREQLARQGLVVAIALLDAGSGLPRRAPLLHGRGLSSSEAKALPRVAQLCLEHLLQLSPQLLRDDPFVQEELTACIRKAFKEAALRRPSVMALTVRQ